MERQTRPDSPEPNAASFPDAAGCPVPDGRSANIDDFELCKAAFQKFVKINRHNSEYVGKYVVFVHGSLYGVGDAETELIRDVYRNVGNVAMYVGSASGEIQTELIESPELR